MIAQAPPATDGPLFAFAGGGTGGHLYPAIAVAEAIRQRQPDARIVFFGTRRRIDRQILDRVECEFVPQELPPLSWVPWRVVNAFLGFRKACQACRERFIVDRPVVVIGTGGMASVPPVREAARAGIPTALFNPDALPGRANRHLARVSGCVFAQFEETIAHFPRGVQVVVSGCPVRPEFQTATRGGGVERLGLDPNRKTLLITGASQGARTVNQAVVATADYLAAQRDWQVLHLTGVADFELVSAGYRGRGVPVKIVAYTEQMAEAMAAADLIVSRAGASTLAEIIAVGRASILIPYPFHRDQHQLVNARCLARVGGARIVNDAIDPVANAPALRAALDELMRADDVREKMGRAARSVGGQGGGTAEVIADRLLEMSGLRGDAAASNRRATRLETVKAL
jgi:UDP-N-acetylglucosamine--N-acetylmuramyl-(pentapeptide) pyrophosphoryl-undecaprenol N-acetylglucosamine transferase